MCKPVKCHVIRTVRDFPHFTVEQLARKLPDKRKIRFNNILYQKLESNYIRNEFTCSSSFDIYIPYWLKLTIAVNSLDLSGIQFRNTQNEILWNNHDNFMLN